MRRYAADKRLDENGLLAFEMYSASADMPDQNPDARFLMLMIAVESLIEQGRKPTAQVDALASLNEHLKTLGLGKADSEVLRQALKSLEDESIGAAGRRLADSLGVRVYGGLTPRKFFTKCYEARSNLVHGRTDRPSIEEVGALIGPLPSFVRDLIVGRRERLAAARDD